MAPTARIRPYKDFLTPALHRRFSKAAAVLAFLCYVEINFCIGEWSGFFWTWFPLGKAGVRAALLFVPTFMIFILRVAQLHVGLRTSNSAFGTFREYATRFQTIQTAAWYLFSAYIFSEVYLWSVPKTADLNRITKIRNTDRPTLNERPIYLTCLFSFVALVQTGYHLYYDYDRLNMPVLKTKPVEAVDGTKAPSAEMKLIGLFPLMVQTAALRAVSVAIVFPVIYTVTVRNFAWGFSRFFAKWFWSLPKSSALPSITPFHWKLLMRSALACFLLLMLWEVANKAFSVYVEQAPLKNDRPITHESRDANGSLLTGLRGKKLQTRAFAFWELVIIAETFQGRRKAIFQDIDRKGGSTWSQILAICLETTTGVDNRIDEYDKKPNVDSNIAGKKEDPIPQLPRIGQPVKDGISKSGDIFVATPRPKGRAAGALEYFDTISKNLGQSPPQTSLTKSKLVSQAEKALLTPKQKEEVAKDGFPALLRDWALWLLQSNAGWPFRQQYSRRLAKVVLGSPYGDVGIIVDAVESLTRLAVCSLQEDSYGNVQRDVKKIIQTLTATVTKLEQFKKTIGFHWTDVEKKEECPEVDLISNALRSGLTRLIEAFGDYSEDLRLSQSEMRQARDAATPAAVRQMEQRR